MPTCPQCGCRWSRKQVINGERRDLANRKYCLDCSPFNQRKSHTDPGPTNAPLGLETRTCIECRQEYQYTRHWSQKQVSTNLTRSPSARYCVACSTRRRRQDRKADLVRRLGGKCTICGYARSLRALDFHHLDPTSKTFTICSGDNYSWNRTLNEVEKCILLCKNCHAEEQDGILDLSRFLPG